MTVKIIGVGNPFREDDGVGPAAVDRLRGTLPPGVTAKACRCEPATLIDAWSGASAVILVDAASPTGAPGRVTRAEALTDLAAAVAPASTHGVGVAQAWALADALGAAPPHVTVFALEGERFDHGQGLSAPVAAALPVLIEAVRAEARRLLDRPARADASSSHA